jgi:hypothetical protein
MNFSLALTSGKIKGVQVDVDHLVRSGSSASTSPDPQQALAVLEVSLLANDVSKQTHDAISKQLEAQASPHAIEQSGTARKSEKLEPATGVGPVAGLILGSPEFQRR